MLDTNIVVDVISRREGYEDSLHLLKQCELGNVNSFVSTITVTDVMYILRKHISPNLVRETVQTLLLIVDAANILKSDIISALSSDMNDYEDAVQSSCAERTKADYIVTRNLKDFRASAVPAISPGKALQIIVG
jgi:predicted nucleic acid-binding protein